MNNTKAWMVSTGVLVGGLVLGPLALSANVLSWGTLPTVTNPMAVGTTYNYSYSVTNTSSSQALPLSVSVVNTQGSGHTPSITSNTCGSALSQGQSCSFQVSLTPLSADSTAGIDDLVTVSWSGRGGSSLTSSIIAKVQASPTASISGPTNTLTTLQVSGTSQTLSYTMTNTGTTSTSAISFSALSGSGETYTNNNCAGIILAPAASCTFAITAAPEADNITSGLPAQTISASYGGSAPATASLAAIKVSNPTLAAIGNNNSSGQSLIYFSYDLGHRWTYGIPSFVGESVQSITGGATLDNANQLLNDTLFVVTRNGGTSGAGYYITKTGVSSASTTNVSAISGYFPKALAYGNIDGTPMFISGLSTGNASNFAYSANGSVLNMPAVSVSDIGSSQPTAAGFGGGYYLLAISGNGGSTNSSIYYTTAPTSTWIASSAIPSMDSITQIIGIAYASPTWVFITNGSGPSVAYNAYYATGTGNPSAWTGMNINLTTSTAALKAIAYDNALGKFVAVDSAGYYYTSTSGTGSWSTGQLVANSFSPVALSYSQSTNTLVLVGGGGKIYYSAGSPVSWVASTGTSSSVDYSGVAASTQT